MSQVQTVLVFFIISSFALLVTKHSVLLRADIFSVVLQNSDAGLSVFSNCSLLVSVSIGLPYMKLLPGGIC